ncbi:MULTISPECIES: hypothetical protein [unclassified Oceanobacter]|uniref:hypothetical protein n=2 Tax=Gammaproteobacteria TaxID=1236 RepID=UPI0026E158CE|nr:MULTISPECIES: hypothetical protein [unclassified Oceanobacter]MDO6680840.1 hypothetical protein [Oceanobacter sp. 5_MG-2023]MDP2504609.1 hypothetical protein [Oceanobacter sp. 3_MG-2023]MDP2546938.1 hypothetical protein [Oceanobacter sp. 4_MG-2023]MDP2607762.1 hypothetical protein [Oceanobacter sp. 1_MG-2023]MDP2611054.1 hypothetical protein [Oceanobacter sp. 2_MG-2023]
MRLLIYEGNIYGFDDSRGFTGTAEYDTSERSVSMSLESRWITGNDEAQGEMMSSGTASNVGVDALLIDESDGTGLIVGTYATGLNAGAITLKADGSWKNSSSLWNTLGVWQAGTTSLYITEVDGRAKFVGQGADSCSFDGELFLLNTDYPLLKAHIYSRSGCNFFTVSTPVDGYAAITSEGMLEFYFTSDSELLRLEYSR